MCTEVITPSSGCPVIIISSVVFVWWGSFKQSVEISEHNLVFDSLKLMRQSRKLETMIFWIPIMTCKDVCSDIWNHHKPVLRWESLHQSAFWKPVFENHTSLHYHQKLVLFLWWADILTTLFELPAPNNPNATVSMIAKSPTAGSIHVVIRHPYASLVWNVECCLNMPNLIDW